MGQSTRHIEPLLPQAVAGKAETKAPSTFLQAVKLASTWTLPVLLLIEVL